MKFVLDWDEYAKKARQAVAEGCVLLKNDKEALPLKEGSKISIFGRIQNTYYKSGTGSGGMVNAPYVISILDAFREEKGIEINRELLDVYEKWTEKNPYNKGKGWAAEPWSQEEMPLSDEVVKKAAESSDEAVIIIGRTAGEDQDNSATAGSYLLTEGEEKMLEKVCAAFDKTVVVLNVGNIIDMSWVAKYDPSAVLYGWQGGMEGGRGVADVLVGRVNPCGHLSDTIAKDHKDYPSTANFNKNADKYDSSTYLKLKHSDQLNYNDEDIYEEDVYVGYRYFETGAKEKVLYPFGFGLSYTTFETASTFAFPEDTKVKVTSRVTNTGSVSGKEVVQVYYEPPQGMLMKPVRNLIAFGKTGVLAPGESEELSFDIDIADMASFDDGGYTGHVNCFVLEKGEYKIYVGSDVRKATETGSFELADTIVVEEVKEALAPTKAFERMTIKVTGKNGSVFIKGTQSVPTRTVDIAKRIKENREKDRPCTGDKGIVFADVASGRKTIEEYVDQFTDKELIYMSRGEGMSSNKVTPGIAGSYGGVSKSLHDHYGMPVAGLSDGPSGIRMDCGAEAFALPIGTALACTFNTELVKELYIFAGKEIRYNKIDSLLGPGINIHRNPLNGRNFEYYSEDPFLTGTMAVAALKGLHTMKVTGTLKHFAANNREFNRHFVNSVVSARALREIYLKGYMMAVKEAGAYNIMTTYGLINGIYTAGNYDLNTTILREEWGFDGVVMTDWWARVNEEGEKGDIKHTGYMIRSQNDLYEVTANSEENGNNDDAEEMLAEGVITRGDLLRNARNIVSSLLRTPVADRLINGEDEVEVRNRPKSSRPTPKIMPAAEYKGGEMILDLSKLDTSAGSLNQFPIKVNEKGQYNMHIRMKSDLSELSQTSMNIMSNGLLLHTITIHGTGGEWIDENVVFEVFVSIDNYIDLSFAQTGIDIDSIVVTKIRSLEESTLF
ncbi:MAG: glycoside hydrolase family 3 C-terminal domain-containing protein [Lachnospiraceae bacterium]|nr:glycoside hydrolase family 3 C-terminal domain-containing protein [Lachnospiraceae bacterium]